MEFDGLIAQSFLKSRNVPSVYNIIMRSIFVSDFDGEQEPGKSGFSETIDSCETGPLSIAAEKRSLSFAASDAP